MDNVKTGKFIRELRKEKNLSQKELAQMLNITDKAVSKWETGKGAPDISHLIPLSTILNISVHELLYGERIYNNTRQADKIFVEAISDTKNNAKKILKRVIAVFFVLLTLISLFIAFEYKNIRHYNINDKYKLSDDYSKLYYKKGEVYVKLERIDTHILDDEIDRGALLYMGNAAHDTKSVVKESFFDDRIYLGYMDKNRILIVVDGDFADYMYFTDSPEDILEYVKADNADTIEP